jgi:Peptidase A4 family
VERSQVAHRKSAAVSVLVVVFTLTATIALGSTLFSTRHMPQQRDAVESPAFFFPETGFGGYSWTGNVKEISARWRVPRMLANSHAGIAATWIGAQTQSNNDFIQIGINEYGLRGGLGIYEAFWSDTAKSFHPQPLGPVSEGERLYFSMTKDSKGWVVRLHNESKSLSEKKQIDYAAGVTFTTAEWIQENPAPSLVTSRDSPYPNIANVTFERVKVNEETPRLGLSDGQVLIASSGAIRVPTAFRDDSFTFRAPTGAARQYLEDAKRLDKDASSFDAEFVTWRTTSTRQRLLDVTQLIDSLQKNITTFETQTWPKPTAELLSQLDQLTRQQVVEFQLWSATSMPANGREYLKFMASVPRHDVLVDKIRASLDLPPLK